MKKPFFLLILFLLFPPSAVGAQSLRIILKLNIQAWQFLSKFLHSWAIVNKQRFTVVKRHSHEQMGKATNNNNNNNNDNISQFLIWQSHHFGYLLYLFFIFPISYYGVLNNVTLFPSSIGFILSDGSKISIYTYITRRVKGND